MSKHILVVDDSISIRQMVEMTLKGAGYTVTTAQDGQEALDFILKQGNYKDAPPPDLILLDVNLPKKNGHEVLQIIKTTESTQQIPVIMLTTSSSEKDINLSYKHHANCYITKPVEAEAFLEAITSIEDFWLTIVKLPKK